MSRTRLYAAWLLAFTVIFLTSFMSGTSTTSTEPPASAQEETAAVSTEPLIPEETIPEAPAATEAAAVQTPVIRQGLTKEDGSLYYYNADGTRFHSGIKEVVEEASTDLYYFLSNGKAFTTGYRAVQTDDTTCYYFFESTGKAFTGGLKDVAFGTETYTYFFGADGKAVTSGWAEQNGAKYYFRANGRAVKDDFVLIDEDRYYFGEDGRVVTGWFCIDDSYYYYADETGALVTNAIVDNYKLDKNGRSRTKYQILEYVNELTDPAMTDQEKIDALYDRLLEGDIYYYNSYEHIKADWNWPAGWIDTFAADMMNNQYGNCFKYAAFLGLMIREATDLPVIIYHGKLPMGDPHGWITVCQDDGWYVYDIQQALQGEDPSVCYKAPYPLERLIDGEGIVLQ